MKTLPPTDIECSVLNTPATSCQSAWIESGLSLHRLIIKFAHNRVADLTKDLSKMVDLAGTGIRLPASGCILKYSIISLFDGRFKHISLEYNIIHRRKDVEPVP